MTTKKFAKDSMTHERRNWKTLKGETIIFNDEDANRLTPPYNDTLLITLRILDNDIKNILIDPGSLANIIEL